MYALVRCRAREGATVVEGADAVNRNEYLFAEFALNLLVTGSVSRAHAHTHTHTHTCRSCIAPWFAFYYTTLTMTFICQCI
jgi:hypothetical protein